MSKNEKVRVTVHNGRINSRGQVYSVNHNDRQFDTSSTGHINSSRSEKNRYKMCFEECSSFEECEKLAYEELFTDGLEERNKKYKNKGVKMRKQIKTMDEYRTSPQSCPEETLLYIGNKDNSATEDELWNATMEFLEWHEKTFPKIVTLNMAMHGDEQGAFHVHWRKVYCAEDKSGNYYAGQKACLQQMGVQPSSEVIEEDITDGAVKEKYIEKFKQHLEKKKEEVREPGEKELLKFYKKCKENERRYSNEKITYTVTCREKWAEIARSYGFELEETKLEDAGDNLETYVKKQNAKKEIEILQKEQQEQREEIEKNSAVIANQRYIISQNDEKIEEQQEQQEHSQREMDKNSAVIANQRYIISQNDKRIEEQQEQCEEIEKNNKILENQRMEIRKNEQEIKESNEDISYLHETILKTDEIASAKISQISALEGQISDLREEMEGLQANVSKFQNFEQILRNTEVDIVDYGWENKPLAKHHKTTLWSLCQLEKGMGVFSKRNKDTPERNHDEISVVDGTKY